MSTVRFVASAFRWIIELMNVLFALILIFAVLVYLFNRDAIVGSAASLGFYSELSVIASFALIAVIYIVFMGLLCVILEIWESLKRIEKGRDFSTGSTEVSRNVRTPIEPRV